MRDARQQSASVIRTGKTGLSKSVKSLLLAIVLLSTPLCAWSQQPYAPAPSPSFSTTTTQPMPNNPTADTTGPAAPAAAPSGPSKLAGDTPEDRAYKAKMIELDQQIVAKITEIQNKQKEIDQEIFPAYVPPLQGDKRLLLQQLNDLKMQRDQLESQKSAKDMQKQLNNPTPPNPPSP